MEYRIKQLREENNVTQGEIAELLGITVRQVDMMENNDDIIEPSQCILLARYYKTNVDYLLGLTDIKEPYKK
ncbi:MAG: helix-turn-helix transcriptional regulator [Oscillospiraceae bacterium]|nr:helix-turn-helix transcriptional regulator [Oscillospiraceae bacterium]